MPTVEMVIAAAAAPTPHGSDKIAAPMQDTRSLDEERLAHTHEHDAAHRMFAVGADVHHLIDDLPRRQIALRNPMRPRHAKDATQPYAADLAN